MVDDPTPFQPATPVIGPDSATSATDVVASHTRVAGHAADAATLVPVGPLASAAVQLPPPGYALGDVIGRGGMGEVVVAQDLRIGREVAVKRMTAADPDGEQVSRFLREARIQARLEHPAIVPVHELGVDDKGRPFFTMKRLAGKTLAQYLAEKLPLNRLPLNRALRVFVDVCLAVEFAHSRGVVHRDLKPSNIMLGDFGEVYVIDWGIARVIADDAGDSRTDLGDIKTLDDGTKTGALLGTPGYMSPEQIRGQRATPAADVYALGSVLFEILAGEPLHKRGEAGIGTTLSTPQVAPAERKPERQIPPELDAICFGMLNELPEKRPTARNVADEVQAFLDGDRDLARRRDLAATQLASAKKVLDSGEPDARAAAMRRAGRALALDPQAEEAAELVSKLLLEPPPQIPADLQEGLDDQDRRLNRDRSRRAVFVYLSVFLLLPSAFFLEIKNWPMVIGFFTTIAVAALASVRFAQTGRPTVAVIMTLNFVLTLMFTRVAGPFVLTPLMVCTAIAALAAVPWATERRWAVIGWTLAAVLVPILAEWLGFLPRTWQIGEGHMMIISDVVRSHGRVTELALVAGNLLCTIVIAVFAVGVSRRRRVAQRQLYVQAWHLRQLLPQAKQAWATKMR